MVFLLAMGFYLIMKAQEEENFCYKKITRFLARKKLGSKEILLGNLNAKRIGDIKDYTEMQ